MLHTGRIPMNEQEHSTVEKLLAKHGAQASLTRRDPGETGPIVLTIGDQQWHVDEDGKSTRVVGA